MSAENPHLAEYPLPLFQIDLSNKVVTMGDKSMQISSRSSVKWDLLVRFFQTPDTSVYPEDLGDAIIEGRKARGWNPMGVDPYGIMSAINAAFLETFAFCPIQKNGTGRNAIYNLKAEIKIVNGDLPPFTAKPPREPEVPVQKTKRKPVVPTASVWPPRKQMNEFAQSQRTEPFISPTSNRREDVTGGPTFSFKPASDEKALLDRLNAGREVSIESIYRELVPDLNEKLDSDGYYITVVKGKFVLKKKNAPRY